MQEINCSRSTRWCCLPVKSCVATSSGSTTAVNPSFRTRMPAISSRPFVSVLTAAGASCPRRRHDRQSRRLSVDQWRTDSDLPTSAVLGGAYTIPHISMEVRAPSPTPCRSTPTAARGAPKRSICWNARSMSRPASLHFADQIAPHEPDQAQPASLLDGAGAENRRRDFTTCWSARSRSPISADSQSAEGATKQNAAAASAWRITSRRPSVRRRMPPGSRSRRMAGRAVVGTQSNGQGHETTFAQIAAAQFGIAPDQIAFRQATPTRRRRARPRRLAFASARRHRRLLAARAIIEKGKRIASNLLEADEHDVDYRPENIASRHRPECFVPRCRQGLLRWARLPRVKNQVSTNPPDTSARISTIRTAVTSASRIDLATACAHRQLHGGGRFGRSSIR